jgi:hypothetical protein
MYLIGGVIHLFLWRRDPGVYAEITPYILFDWYRGLWTGYVLPNLEILLPILAGFEILLAGLVLSQGRRARLGHGIGAAFQVTLAPLGFWWPTNAVLAVGHVLLSRYQFPVALIADLRRQLRESA